MTCTSSTTLVYHFFCSPHSAPYASLPLLPYSRLCSKPLLQLHPYVQQEPNQLTKLPTLPLLSEAVLVRAFISACFPTCNSCFYPDYTRSAFKLFRNTLAWGGVLSDAVLGELALDRLLNRSVLIFILLHPACYCPINLVQVHPA